MKKVSVYEVNGKQFTTAKEAKNYDNLIKLGKYIEETFSSQTAVRDLDAEDLQAIISQWETITKPAPRVKAGAVGNVGELPPGEVKPLENPDAPAPAPTPEPAAPASAAEEAFGETEKKAAYATV